jgi:nucleoside-diphosphate-sugar epimerase
MSTIVVTGAGGFVGAKLVRILCGQGETVVGIGRSAEPASWPASARWIRADLSDAAVYETALAGADCVVHLAAVTGKASRAAYLRGNVEATRELIGACERTGVGRFVFVSSIAVKFTHRRHYHYAESKISAEALVQAASITSIIVRPTMILGPGSPIEASLAKLARLPLSPLFGDGRRLVQPVDVDDVADALAALARAPNFAPAIVELGGPERYDLRELYARLRSAYGVHGAPRLLSAPLGLSRWMLAMVEAPLLPLLPLTAGQLATFANDGTAAPHEALERLLPTHRISPRAPEPTDGGDDALDSELTRHARYLAGVAPTSYQRSKYRDFHARRPLTPADAFDALLLRVSRLGGVGLALADSYSALLRRDSALRAKLVLTAAILESSAPSFEVLDSPGPGGPLLAYARIALRGAAAGFSFVLAAAILGPAQIILRAKPAQ